MTSYLWTRAQTAPIPKTHEYLRTFPYLRFLKFEHAANHDPVTSITAQEKADALHTWCPEQICNTAFYRGETGLYALVYSGRKLDEIPEMRFSGLEHIAVPPRGMTEQTLSPFLAEGESLQGLLVSIPTKILQKNMFVDFPLPALPDYSMQGPSKSTLTALAKRYSVQLQSFNPHINLKRKQEQPVPYDALPWNVTTLENA